MIAFERDIFERQLPISFELDISKLTVSRLETLYVIRHIGDVGNCSLGGALH